MIIKKYEAELKKTPYNKIYLNVDKLKKGDYTIKIIQKKKVIKIVQFSKK